ncbi:unnamed protein product [Leuciscus chuanchicus]
MNYQQDKATLWRGPRTIQIREVDITLENISRIFKRLALSCYPAQQGTLGTSNYQGDMRFVERKALLHQCHCQPNLSQHNLICSDLRPGLWLLLSVQDQRLHQPQEAFRGLLFWKQNARKIVALCDSAYQDLMRRKRRRTSGIDDQTVRCVEELVLAAEELPAITEALRDLGLYARANRVSTVALTGDQVATVRSTFQCLICRDLAQITFPIGNRKTLAVSDTDLVQICNMNLSRYCFHIGYTGVARICDTYLSRLHLKKG